MPLWIVPTPLGNLGDITARAVKALSEADLIACEDTRRTLGLLNHLGIAKPLVSYHGHSGPGKLRRLLDALQSGQKVAMVSDAGTPGLSDPGTELVQAALEAGLPVQSLPGPSAVITALVGSGLPTDRFFFIGFLPRRPSRARRMLQAASALDATVVVYESPFRTKDTVEAIGAVAGAETQVVVARELTKIHEEFIRGTASEVLAHLTQTPPKGEVVILFRKPPEEDTEKEEA